MRPKTALVIATAGATFNAMLFTLSLIVALIERTPNFGLVIWGLFLILNLAAARRAWDAVIA